MNNTHITYCIKLHSKMIYFDEEDEMNKRLQKRTFTLNRYVTMFCAPYSLDLTIDSQNGEETVLNNSFNHL